MSFQEEYGFANQAARCCGNCTAEFEKGRDRNIWATLIPTLRKTAKGNTRYVCVFHNGPAEVDYEGNELCQHGAILLKSKKGRDYFQVERACTPEKYKKSDDSLRFLFLENTGDVKVEKI